MRTTRLAVVVLALVLGLAGLAACDPAPPDQYAALGDSYTAGPLILPQDTDPLGCLRSGNDYPTLAFPATGLKTLYDASCSGAETDDITNAQGVTPGPNQPQIDWVNSQTAAVSIGIGGNDIGFSSIVKDCARINPFDSPCKNNYVVNGVDQLRARITATAPKVAAVLKAIKAKGPNAKIFVVGYPSVLPNSGGGCWPTVPILDTDVAYLRGINQALNTMLKNQAFAAGAIYVDWYTPSIGHDACSGSGRWVEPIIPNTDAAPVHPNKTGMKGLAAILGPKIKAALAG